MSFPYFLLGTQKLRVKKSDAAAFADALMSTSLAIHEESFSGEWLYFSALPTTAKKILALCRTRGIECEKAESRGLPFILYRYRHRCGILLGLFLYAAIVFLSGRVLWSIEIEGNLRLDDSEIRETLRAQGVHVGAFKSRIDVHSAENNIMIMSDDIAWISLNIRGGVCGVEIRETERKEDIRLSAASNVVAAKDGKIVLFENTRGNIVLNIGDRVREGELIISGLYDSKQAGIRYTAARGRVLAETEKTLRAEIPLDYEKKVYTGRAFTEKYLIFFEKEIKIYGKCGNLYGSCDTIDMVEYFDPLSLGDLPVGIRTVTYLEYTSETARRTEDEARALAEYKLGCLLSATAANAELLSKQTSHTLNDSVYRIDAALTLIEDIAKLREIEIDNLP